MAIPIVVQTYGLRDRYLGKGREAFITMLEEVGGIDGVSGVELIAGFIPPDLPATELKAVLDDNGLGVYGIHHDIAAFQDPESMIDLSQTLENDVVVLPAVKPEEWYATPEKVDELVEILAKAQDVVGDGGLLAAFHNHAVEFYLKRDGMPLFTYILRKSGVQGELDLFWAERGGVAASVALTFGYGGLIYIHFKDGGLEGAPSPSTANVPFAELGTGALAGELVPSCGQVLVMPYVKAAIVEQDGDHMKGDAESEGNSLVSTQVSVGSLKSGMAEAERLYILPPEG